MDRGSLLFLMRSGFMDLNQVRKLASIIAYASSHLGLVDGYRLMRRQWSKPQIAILWYHRVEEPAKAPWSLPAISPQDFERQMRYLRKCYDIISIDTLIRLVQEKEHLPRMAVVITFDDGYKDNFTNAYPILRKYDVPATISLTAANIDQGELLWWDKVGYIIWTTPLQIIDLGELGRYSLRSSNQRKKAICRITEKLKSKTGQEKELFLEEIVDVSHINIPPDLGKEVYLSWDDVLEMNKNGITFGAHSVTHPNLALLPLEEAKHEIAQSKKSIDQQLNQDTSVFCYPNGDFNPDVARLVEEEGFKCALTQMPEMIKLEVNPYQLGRVPGGWNLDTLKLFTCGVYTDLAGKLL